MYSQYWKGQGKKLPNIPEQQYMTIQISITRHNPPWVVRSWFTRVYFRVICGFPCTTQLTGNPTPSAVNAHRGQHSSSVHYRHASVLRFRNTVITDDGSLQQRKGWGILWNPCTAHSLSPGKCWGYRGQSHPGTIPSAFQIWWHRLPTK